MGYYILHQSGSSAVAPAGPPTNEMEELRTQLAEGGPQDRQDALRRLVALQAEDILAKCLACPRPEVARLATDGLWECWLNEGGRVGRRRMEEGIDAMNAGDLEVASEIFARLMEEFPDWAEAINKRATALYLRGELLESIELCRRVVALKPDHFGAWNGMAICAMQVEEWPLALAAVRESLRLQPHSQANQQLLRLVQTRLPVV